MPKLPRVNNVFYAADDMAASRKFYEGVLGIDVKFADGDRWAQYDLGDTRFALGAERERLIDMRGAAVVFEVATLEACEQRVAEFGGRVLERRDMGTHGTTLVIADPAGNVSCLLVRGVA